MTLMGAKSGKAGTADRNDAEVEFVHATAGGLQVDIVPCPPEDGSTDGAALEAAARELLADLEVTAGRVTVRDHAAPPWVVKARLEAALGRAGVAR
jgi:citrate lyase gamma subunit